MLLEVSNLKCKMVYHRALLPQMFCLGILSSHHRLDEWQYHITQLNVL